MVARDVQMFKVTLVGLHFAPIDEVESHADEDLLDFFDRAREDVPAAQMAVPPGQGDVQALLLQLRGGVPPGHASGPAAEAFFDLGADFVQGLAGRAALRLRQLGQAVEEHGQAPPPPPGDSANPASCRSLAISSCIPSSRQNEARSRPWDESAFFRGTTRLPGRRSYPLSRALYAPRHGGASGGTTHGGPAPGGRARFPPRL